MDTTTEAARPTTITKRLDHLPLVAQAFERLRLAKTIDELVPRHPRNHVSAGQCVEALVAAILSGTRPLYRVAETLANPDLETAFGWSTDVSCFSDERLESALDAIHKAGVSEIGAEVFFRTLEEYSLELGTVLGDTTSASVFGAYSTCAPPSDPEDPDAILHPTKGRSKDRRGLKQVIYGTAVTTDGVPICGRVSSGNRNDSLESRFLLRRLAELLPDPTETTFVCDSKFCAGETLALAGRFGISYVTLLPRSVGLWKIAFDRFLEAKAAGLATELKSDLAPRRTSARTSGACGPAAGSTSTTSGRRRPRTGRSSRARPRCAWWWSSRPLSPPRSGSRSSGPVSAKRPTSRSS